MFKFNFDNARSSKSEDLETFGRELQVKTTDTENGFKAEFIEHGCQVCKECSKKSHVENKIGSRTFYIFNSELAESHIKSDNDSIKNTAVLEAISSHSDLIARKYEGGLKVWECGVDLVTYCIKQNITFSNKTVLELGCGAGMPGIYARSTGAELVYFQDFNVEVLKHFTYPCINLNEDSDVEGEDSSTNYRMISGDWSSLPALLHGLNFDVILTAETIYNTDSYPALHTIFSELLSSSGVIYVAAKTTYFGVGGSIREFLDYVEKQGVFTVTASESIPGGVPRIIIEMKRKCDFT